MTDTTTASRRPVLEGSIAYSNAEDDLQDAFVALEAEAPKNATEKIVEACRQAAAHHGLTDDEFAFLLTEHLLVWRMNGLHAGLSSGWATNIASFALACVPEDDPGKWVCEHADRLLSDAQAVLDDGGMVAKLSLPAMYAYYTADGIWSTGRTPEEAVETFIEKGRLSRDEIEALQPMETAPMTDGLAEYVERHGFQCGRDQFRVLANGMLDMMG